MAWPGFVAGHVLTFGRPHGGGEHGGVDAHLLDVGGSGQLLMAAAGLLLAGLLVQSARRALRGDDRLPVRATLTAAAVAQVALFVVIEVAERGWALATTVADPSVAVGVTAQLVVAAVIIAVLTLFTEAVRAVAPPVGDRRPLRAAVPVPPRAHTEVRRTSTAILQRAAPRAPPAFADR